MRLAKNEFSSVLISTMTSISDLEKQVDEMVTRLYGLMKDESPVRESRE